LRWRGRAQHEQDVQHDWGDEDEGKQTENRSDEAD